MIISESKNNLMKCIVDGGTVNTALDVKLFHDVECLLNLICYVRCCSPETENGLVVGSNYIRYAWQCILIKCL